MHRFCLLLDIINGRWFIPKFTQHTEDVIAQKAAAVTTNKIYNFEQLLKFFLQFISEITVTGSAVIRSVRKVKLPLKIFHGSFFLFFLFIVVITVIPVAIDYVVVINNASNSMRIYKLYDAHKPACRGLV